MTKPPPASKDVQEFQFRLQSKLKIFDFENNSVFYNATNLISASSRFGIVFIGTPHSTFQVIKLRDIELFTIKEGETDDYPCRTVTLPSNCSHLQVNCDGTLLSVVTEDKNCAVAAIYKVVSFLCQNIEKISEIRLSSKPGVRVLSTCWNPTISGLFTVCKDDGSLALYELKDTGVEIHELPSDAKASCMCWSPKGKQLVVGAQDGRLIQYKPDLKAVKAIDAPNLDIPHSVLTVQWLSNYQFAAVYEPNNKSSSGILLIIDAPKTGSVVYTNFEDICYSYSNMQQAQFYLEHISSWGTLLVASSNSIELGVLGGEAEGWTQWIQDDGNRCELPLGAERQDTLPVGLAITTGTTLTLKRDFKSEEIIPPAPLLLLLSNHGLLCCFSVINLLPGIPQICSPPEAVPDQSGANLFIKQIKAPVNVQPVNKITSMQNPTVQPSTQYQALTQPQVNVQPQVAPQEYKMPNSNTTQFSLSQVKLATTKPDYTINSAPLHFAPTSNLAPTKVTSAPVVKSAVQPSQVQEAVIITHPKSVLIKSNSEENLVHRNANIILLNNSIKEECINFQTEIREVLEQSKNIKVELGTDQEHIAMIQLADNLTKFQMELRDTTTSQAAEIHYLKQSLMQAFAWCEDARSRHLRFNDPGLSSLMRAQDLDPVNQARLADLNHLLYYLESQLRQVDNTLDEQWSLFQDSLKKTMKIQLPTLEAVYQSMVRQNAILMKQSFILKDISSRIKSSNNNKKNHVSLITTTLNVGTTGDLAMELKNLQIEPADAMQGKYDRVIARERHLSMKKQEKLRDFFLNRNVTHISTSKPCLSNSILNMTPNCSMKKMHPVFSSTAVNTPNIKKNLFPDVSAVDSFAVDEAPLSPVQKATILPQSTPKQPVISHQFKPVMQQENVPQMTSNVKNIVPSQPLPIFGNAKAPTFVTSSQTNLFQQPLPFGTTITMKTTPGTTSSTTGFKFSLSPNATTTPVPQLSFSTKPSSTLKPDNIITISPVMKPTIIPAASTPSLPFSLGIPKSVENKSDSVIPANISIFKVTEAPKTNSPATNTLPPPQFSFKGLGTNTSSNPAIDVKITTEAKSPFASALNPAMSSIFKASTQSTPIFGTSSISSGGSAFAPLSSGTLGNASPNSLFSSTKLSGSLFSTNSNNAAVSTSSPLATTVATPQTVAATKPSLFSFSSGPTTESTLSSPSTGTIILNVPSVTTSSPTANVTPKAQVPSSAPELFARSPLFGAPTLSPTDIISSTSDTGKPADPTVQSVTESSSPVTPVSPLPTSVPSTDKPAASTEATTSSPSIFGAPPIASTADTSPTPQTSTLLFGAQSATSTSPTVTTTTSQSTLFGQPQTTSDTKPSSGTSLFGSSNTTIATSSSPVFGGFSPDANIFSGSGNTVAESASKPAFDSSTTTTLPSFGAVSISPAASMPTNVFGAASSTAAGSVFGSSAAITSSNVFGGAITSSAPSNLFGNKPIITSTTPSNVFGGSANIVSSTPSNAFGSSPSSAASNVFGGATAVPSSTPSNIFGGASGSLFGSPAASGESIFAQNTNKAPFSSGGSIFGGAPVFGAATSSTSTPFGSSTTGNIFGGASQTATTTTSSVFGAPVSSSATFGSTNSSIFGAKPTGTSSTGFGFGSTNNSKSDGSSFSFGNLSVTALSPNATPATTTASPFGGFSQNPFAKSSTTTSTFMGQNICSPFGGGGAGGAVSGGSIFGAPATTSASTSVFGGAATSSGFGSPSTGAFGSSPSFGSGGGSFGQPPAFGQQTTFGSPPAFGASATGGAFGATQSPQQNPGTFSAGNQSVGQTGFGGFQKPANGFGSAPVFGSSSPGGFGAAPSFGGAPAFGTPPKMFGAASPQATSFGSPTQENPTFANLASQNTVGFGSLAQAQKNAAPSTFSGNSSFSSWR